MQLSKSLFAVIGLSLTMVACGDAANIESDADATQQEGSALKPMELLTAVWDSSAHEHTAAELAKLASHRSKNATVLAWAKQSQTAHQQQYDAIVRLADAKHLKAAKIYTIEGTKLYGQLFALGSRAFDAEFKKAMTTMQTRGIDYATALTDVTTDVQLRTWAEQTTALYQSEQQSAGNLP